MLNKDALYLGESLAPGWRKIIVTATNNPGTRGSWPTGFAQGTSTIWNGRIDTYPGSYLSDTSLGTGKIKAIATSYWSYMSSSGESSVTKYSQHSFIDIDGLSLGDHDSIYVQKGKNGKLFQFRGGNWGLSITHIHGTSSVPSTTHADCLFFPEDRGKVLDIYIGLTPPHKKIKKSIKKALRFRRAFSC